MPAEPEKTGHPQIAIDGPAGVGKSTIGERVAQHLGCLYVDTGAFYRALTVLALDRYIAPDDGVALATLARTIPITIVPPTVNDGRQYTVQAEGRDLTRDLRTPGVERAISQVSKHPAVRTALIAQMRAMAAEQTVVMVGRDIGTEVLPHADLKIYLMTSIDERARRRHGDLVAQMGAEGPSFEQVRAEMIARDAGDKEQMRPAPDAVVIDNTHLETEQTAARVLAIFAERFPTWLAARSGNARGSGGSGQEDG